MFNILKKYLKRADKLETRRLWWDYYNKWQQQFFRYCTNLFIWENLPCTDLTMESYLISKGFAGLADDKKEGAIIVVGGLNGVTNYPLEFKQLIYATPLTSGTITFGENGELCNNNRTRMSLMPLIDIYANTMAHIEISIEAATINRRTNMLFTADNQATADTINTWYKNLQNGELMAVIDKNNLNAIAESKSINTYTTNAPISNELTELYGIKQNTIRDFFTEIGFVSDKSKQERLVTAELSVNSYRVLYGVSDMEQERKDFCERVNDNKVVRAKLKGDLSVKFNPYIVDEINDLVNLNERGINIDEAVDDRKVTAKNQGSNE